MGRMACRPSGRLLALRHWTCRPAMAMANMRLTLPGACLHAATLDLSGPLRRLCGRLKKS
jgi:hypothetical protein